MLAKFDQFRPGALKGMDVVITDAEAEELMAGFRKEMPGIRQWLLEGYLSAKRKMQ